MIDEFRIHYYFFASIIIMSVIKYNQLNHMLIMRSAETYTKSSSGSWLKVKVMLRIPLVLLYSTGICNKSNSTSHDYFFRTCHQRDSIRIISSSKSYDSEEKNIII